MRRHLKTFHLNDKPYSKFNPMLESTSKRQCLSSSPPDNLQPTPNSQQYSDIEFKFHHPFTMMVAGPTMSGKSTWIKELLIHNAHLISPLPERILWIYKRWQPLYDELKSGIPCIEFIQGITEDIQSDSVIDSRKRTLLVIDDLMKDATQDKNICELFIEGAHHRNMSVICIMQNIFNKGKEQRTMSLNSQYIVLFRNPRDRQQIDVLARQMYPGNTKKLLNAYEKAVSVPYGALVLDLKQYTPESRRFQTDIFRQSIGTDDALIINKNHITEDGKGIKTFSEDLQGEQNIGFAQLTNPISAQKRTKKVPSMENDVNSWTVPLNMTNHPTTEQEERYPSCDECGTVFASLYDLKRHMKNGCPIEEETDESDAMSDVSDDDDTGFNPLINEVWAENEPFFDKKVDLLLKDNLQLSKSEAREEASDLMLHKDRSLLFKKYKRLLMLTANLNRSKLHRNIKQSVSDLLAKQEDTDLDKTISYVLNRYKLEFDQLLLADENDYNDNPDDKSEDTEDVDD